MSTKSSINANFPDQNFLSELAKQMNQISSDATRQSHENLLRWNKSEVSCLSVSPQPGSNPPSSFMLTQSVKHNTCFFSRAG